MRNFGTSRAETKFRMCSERIAMKVSYYTAGLTEVTESV